MIRQLVAVVSSPDPRTLSAVVHQQRAALALPLIRVAQTTPGFGAVVLATQNEVVEVPSEMVAPVVAAPWVK